MDSVSFAAGDQRIDEVDVLRGLALTGICLVHLEEYYELNLASPATATILHVAIITAFAGKAFALLALCFGFSFQAISDQADRQNRNFSTTFAWRSVLLGGIGWLHGLLYRGDVLTLLAVIGLLLIPLRAVRSNRALLGMAVVCFAQPYLLWCVFTLASSAGAHIAMLETTDPAMPIYLNGTLSEVVNINLWIGQLQKWSYQWNSGRALQMTGYAIIGIMVGRTGFFSRPPLILSRGRGALRIVVITLFTLIVGKIALHVTVLDGSPLSICRKALLASWLDLLLTFGYLAIFIRAWHTDARKLLTLFAPLGRMSLSFYAAQSLCFVPLFYHFGWGGYAKLGENSAAAIGLVACVVQLRIAIVWQRHFKYGPLEWLWRAGTGLNLDMPFRIRAHRRQLAAPMNPDLG